MQHVIRGNRSGVAQALHCAAAALLCVAVLGLPDIARAAADGAGGFHGGGGFRGGGSGGFHGGGFHGFAGGWHGGFAGGNWHGGVAGGNWHGGNWYHGWHNGRYGWWWGGPAVGFTFYDYPYWDGYYSDYGYGQQPYAGQYWYYCSDPAGYYPYVQQCNVPWQPVPPS
jgi:hypothetical protein